MDLRSHYRRLHPSRLSPFKLAFLALGAWALALAWFQWGTR